MGKNELYTPENIGKYKQRSEYAIKGINVLMQKIPKLLEHNTIRGKYKKLLLI